MRERYQLCIDEAQETAAAAVELAWGVCVERMAMTSCYDWKLWAVDGLMGIGEFKLRDWSIDSHSDGVMLSRTKAQRITGVAHTMRVPVWFFVRARNGLFSHQLGADLERRYELRTGGRTVHTRDRWDIERVIIIPCASFNPVITKEADL